GLLPDLFQGPSGICLLAQDRESGQVPYQSRFCAAHVPAVGAFHHRRCFPGGEVMSLWSSLKDAKAALLVSFKNWRLWLGQFVGNAVLFAAFLWWLQIPEAHWWQLGFQLVLLIAIGVGALLLHGGTLNYFLSAHQQKGALLAPAFRKALRHVPAIAVWAVIFF